MKLHYWRSSPHSCKVLAVLDYLGLQKEVDLIPTHPWEPNSGLVSLNPLEKIPTLIDKNGDTLYDSSVICRYLAFISKDQEKEDQLYPKEGPHKWIALRHEALAGGIMEAAVLRLLEERARPSSLQSKVWIHRQQGKIQRSLKALEDEAIRALKPDQPTIGHISLAIALSYLVYRYPSFVWHVEYPQLSSWYEIIIKVPEIARNLPKEIHSLPSDLEKLD